MNKLNQKEHWENVYQNKSAEEVSWYQETPTISLSITQKLNLQKKAAIIDVGGGASTFVDGLLQAGFEQVSVLDLSSNALELAKQRLGVEAEKVNWRVEDVMQLKTEQKYTFWHDRAVFHFLTQAEERVKYKKALLSSVVSGGYAMIAAFSIGGPKQCSGLNIVQYDADKIRKELEGTLEWVEEVIETHLTPNGKEQLFRYFIFRKV